MPNRAVFRLMSRSVSARPISLIIILCSAAQNVIIPKRLDTVAKTTLEIKIHESPIDCIILY